MSKSRLFSGKIKKLGSTKLTADRYEYLDTSQAEPDLGPPNLNGSVLTGSTTTNIRNWSDILTIEGATVRIRSTLSNIGFYTPNALVVDGGIGVAGDVNILGKALINNVEVLTTQSGLSSQFGQSIINLTLRITTSTNSTGTSSGALVVYGGVGINKDVYIGGTTFAGNVYSNGSLVGSSTGTTSSFLIDNLTSATSTNSGALQVVGGVGIGGALFVNTTSYIANSEIITTATINQYASKNVIIAGTDTAINTSTGNITIWNTSTLQTITDRGNSTTNIILITTSTNSTATTTGALVVSGGVGIGQNLNVGGTLFVNTTSYISGSEIITTATVNTYADKTVITAGTDTAINTSTGYITIWNTSTLQTITDRGNASTNPISITNLTLSTSTDSGALIVSGGVGIGEALYVNSDIFTRGQKVITTATVNDYADKTIITAGTDTVVNTSTGNITIWNNSTLQTITDRGKTTTNAISITNFTQSTSSTTGALTVSGGVGIERDLYIGGNLNISTGSSLTIGNQSITQTTIQAGTDTAVNTSTGVVTIWNTSTLQTITDRGQTTTNAISITNTSTSTTPSTGALVVTGGVGIGENLYVGNKLAVLNTLSSTSSIYQNAAYIEGGLGVGKSLYVTGPAVFQNNVTFLGTTTYVLTTNTVYTDNLIELHYPSTPDNLWTVDDGLDIGFRFHYYDGGSDRNAGLVLSNDNKYLEWYSRGNEDTTSSFTGSTYGTFKTGNIILTNTTTSTSTTTGALTVSGGVGLAGNLNVGGDIVGGGVRSTSSSTAPVVATIGDIWYNTNNDRLYRYTTFDTFNKFWLDFTGQKVKYLKNLTNITPPPTVEYLVVGGGGGGSPGQGGGGGAGGFLTNLSTFGYAVSTGPTYTITVGAGGPAGASPGTKGSNGDYSQFDNIIASGGGGGGAVGNGNGNNGGSGGGAASTAGGAGGGSSSNSQGFPGGNVGNNVAPFLGAGGGGASSIGSNGGGTTTPGNGNGGAGTTSNISGTTLYYAGGGGGGLYYSPINGIAGGQGGIGGGGNGASSDVAGTAGTEFTGGGGGAGYSGGKGIVIIRYPSTYLGPTLLSGATVVVNNGYRIYTWKISGSIAF